MSLPKFHWIDASLSQVTGKLARPVTETHYRKMAARTLREHYCEVFNCSTQEFSERVFWQCLPPQSVSLARLIRTVNGSFFRPDLELIEQVANSTSVDDVHAEIEEFRYHHPPAGLLRRVLQVRVSGERLLQLSAKVLSRNMAQENPQRLCPGRSTPAAVVCDGM